MKQSPVSFALLLLLTGISLSGCGQNAGNIPIASLKDRGTFKVPPKMHLIEPSSSSKKHSMNNNTSLQQKPEELKIGQGNFFSYALPPGWKIGEDGQFAISLVSPDHQAMTVMVGNSGLMPGYNPGQFVYEKMMVLRPANLQLSNAIRTTPVNGFQDAYKFQVAYSLQSGNYTGEAVCHITNYYGGCVMAMTAALSEQSQWTSYKSWLPQVSRQLSATNGAAFGMRGIMQQNLQNSKTFGEAMTAYRAWSHAKWQEVTDDRNASVDRQHYQFRENLGAVNTWTNPYNTNSPIELTTQYQYYWIDQQGRVLGTNDAGVNPNHGSTIAWKQLQRKANP
jgi:hypothetical protein